MASVVEYAIYIIYFRDLGEYESAVGVYGYEFDFCPQIAAATFGLTFPPAGGGLDPVKGLYYVAPFTDGEEIRWPEPTGVFMDASINVMTAPGQTGNPNAFPAGPDLELRWMGVLTRAGGAVGTPASVAAEIPQRRWVTGWSVNPSGESVNPLFSARCSRDASRTVDGFGFAMRNLAPTNVASRDLDEYRTGLTSATSWERLYIRLRTLPSGASMFWDSRGFPSAAAGARLEITASGQIAISSVNSVGTVTLLGTMTALTLNKWYRIDILLRYNTAPVNGDGTIIVYTTGPGGGEITGFNVGPSTGGIGQNSSRHVSSRVGTATAASGLEMDIDDWINADVPNVAGVQNLTSVDWLSGSHVQDLYTVAAGALDSGNWLGNFRSLNQGHSVQSDTAAAMARTTTTSGARLAGLTDAEDAPQLTGQTIGAAAAVVSIFASRVSVDGTLGYSLVGAAPVLTSITQNSVAQFNSVMYAPATMADPDHLVPDPVAPFQVVHDRGAAVTSSSLFEMMAMMEYVGTWGLEDDPDTVDYRVINIHNCWYPNMVAGATSPPTISSVYAVGGTYTGNGTGQSITLPAPPHFIWIRPLTGASGVPKWISTCLAGHRSDTDRTTPAFVTRAFYTPATQDSGFDVSGADTQINANGVSYQYIAFCDTGSRFCLNGAFNHSTNLATQVNPLIDTTFTPEAAFFFNELANSASNAQGIFYKGPGSTGTVGQHLAGSDDATVASLAIGAITSAASLHSTTYSQCAYNAWRTTDPCGNIMLQILSYTGNGTNPRTITLTPTSGRFPLFVYVQPHNGSNGFFRDPSHTGSQSSNYIGTTVSTVAITGVAMDAITVNSALNTNGVLYDVFVICGDSGGMNNGEFYPPNCAPTGTQFIFPPSSPAPPASGGACLVSFPLG